MVLLRFNIDRTKKSKTLALNILVILIIIIHLVGKIPMIGQHYLL